MKSHKETFKELILDGTSPSLRTSIDLNPALVHIEMGIASVVQDSSSQGHTTSSSSMDPLTAFWDVLRLTTQSLTTYSSGPDHTVQDVANYLDSQPELRLPLSIGPQNIDTLQHLAVAAIGWTTFLFSWKGSVLKNTCTIEGGPSLKQTNPRMEDCERSVSKFISPWGLTPPMNIREAHVENLLYLSNLNFHSLTHVGRLQVKWVPYLSQHLVLDSRIRTLYLFQYPSICVLALSGGNYGKLVNQILQGLCSPEPSDSLHREILLSLKFIFGETRKSRRLAKKTAFLNLQNQDCDDAFNKLFDGNLDHVLLRPATSPTGKLPRQDILAPWIDFPLLGERLLQIQKYNEQQRPTSTRAMIRDKRNPSQWYTLWAVLLIGGLSVVLSLMQLGVAIAQLVTSL